MVEGGIILKDHSTYGIALNGMKTKEGMLKYNEIVQFGVYENKFKLEEINVTICLSGMKSEEKKRTINMCNQIGINISDEIDKNTKYLIMNEVKITEKLILALINSCVVTNSSFIEKIHSNGLDEQGKIKSDFCFPDANNSFKPVIPGNVTFDLSPSPERRTLFQGCKFVISDASQMQRLKRIIEAASGQALSKSTSDYQEIFIKPPMKKNVHANENCIEEEDISLAIIRKSFSKLKRCNTMPINKPAPTSIKRLKTMPVISPISKDNDFKKPRDIVANLEEPKQNYNESQKELVKPINKKNETIKKNEFVLLESNDIIEIEAPSSLGYLSHFNKKPESPKRKPKLKVEFDQDSMEIENKDISPLDNQLKQLDNQMTNVAQVESIPVTPAPITDQITPERHTISKKKVYQDTHNVIYKSLVITPYNPNLLNSKKFNKVY
ncbi:hypothetical protein O9G_003804 [Rozella allomycis CSF55]|uniref:Nibrin second BRCT domain-containing protein n=1 Tax=Rozella allomycis (strain CSF55) TaxID=988480 RepID=A0A075AQW6_ROZAC|nr:hypothetical protein O9G_003804 [Rozella allomycis CSF55]|eukprot:EPZ32676.1 hypothetical protein O9G_003804 [Rozella allomycis CSF55]